MESKSQIKRIAIQKGEADYWTRNGLKKPQQIVVCAANRYGKIIVTGARHFDKVMCMQIEAMGGIDALVVDHISGEQGFIDQFGDFLTREEAMQIVKENGQPFSIERNRGDSCLFSEGLY